MLISSISKDEADLPWCTVKPVPVPCPIKFIVDIVPAVLSKSIAGAPVISIFDNDISLLLLPVIAAVPATTALKPSTENCPSIDSSRMTLLLPLNNDASIFLTLPVTPANSIPEDVFSPIIRPSICNSTCLAQIPNSLHESNSTSARERVVVEG